MEELLKFKLKKYKDKWIGSILNTECPLDFFIKSFPPKCIICKKKLTENKIYYIIEDLNRPPVIFLCSKFCVQLYKLKE